MQLEAAFAVIDRVVPSLEGWCTVDKARRMAALVVEYKAQRCVELGVFGGRSLVALGLGLKVLGAGHVDGIDPFTAAASLEGKNDPANDKWWGQIDYMRIERYARAALKTAEVEAFASIIKGRSLDADVLARYEPGSIDVLHVDSNHSEEVSCAEVEAWASKLAPGGLWIADDADWPTMQKAQKRLDAVGIELFEHHRQWAVFRKAVTA